MFLLCSVAHTNAIVSDTASIDSSADKSGPTIKEFLKLNSTFEILDGQFIVPDNLDAIRSFVREWCQVGSVDWVITTGGTGFGVRDVTPEVSSECYHRRTII